MSRLFSTSSPSTADLTAHVHDQLLLRTIGGAEDLLAEAVRNLAAASAVRTEEGRVICQVQGSLRQLQSCRLFSSAADLLEGATDTNAFLATLQRSARMGVIATLPSENPLRFRVAASPRSFAREIRASIQQGLGWLNDPSDWMINIEETTHGWVAEIGPLFWTRRFGQLERTPWSTNPVVAEILVRLAKLRDQHRVLDPFCGTGTLLMAAHSTAPAAALTGSDIDDRALALAMINFSRFGVDGQLRLGDAVLIPEPDSSVDRVICNLPFGKRVGSHDGNKIIYPAALNEIRRILTADGRVVLLTDDKRLLRTAIARTAGLKIVRERLLRFSGVTPTVFVLRRC